ncbi:hypothetical protein LguiB_017675 [Lonicera macranthoides]
MLNVVTYRSVFVTYQYYNREEERSNDTAAAEENAKLSFYVDDFFDFSNEDPLTFEWVSSIARHSLALP